MAITVHPSRRETVDRFEFLTPAVGVDDRS